MTNQINITAAAFGSGETETVARVVLERGLAGGTVSARFVVERLRPTPGSRPIVIDVLPDAGPDDMIKAAVRAMAIGRITTAEARTVARLLERRRNLHAAARQRLAIEREVGRHAAAATAA